MRISEVVRRVRDLLKDHGGSTWDVYEITRYIDQAVLYMFRAQAEVDGNYHNYELSLLGSDATQLHANVWVYRIPRWVFRVTRVRLAKGSTESIGSEVFPGNFESNVQGWYFDSLGTIRLVGYQEAQDLTASICKVPAKLHQGITPANAADSTHMYTMDHPASSNSAYELENEPNAYVNSIFELTGIADASRDPVGQIRRCVGSARAKRTGTSYYTNLTLANAWTEDPNTNDTYEMHPEIDDAHVRFLVLLAARYAFMANHNTGALSATQIDFSDERRRFLDSRSPRDDGLPHFWGTEAEWEAGVDPDRDFLLGRYGEW